MSSTVADIGQSPATVIDLAALFPRVAEAVRASSIHAVGAAELVGKPAVGVCGSRDATVTALERAFRFGELAAECDLGIVSGNARGVDEATQRGALLGGGWVAAVLAEGLTGWKPRKDHRPLITATNLVALSKYDDDARWTVWRAMDRNKLIIALSRALVVVQAGTKGGTWEAGLACLRQKKPLLVVEGRSGSLETEGNRELIARGGRRITTFNELRRVLEALREKPAQIAPKQVEML